MTPGIAIAYIQCFVRWNGEKFERLDAPHEAIANPAGWRRGSEYWISAATWREIFADNEDAAVVAAQR